MNRIRFSRPGSQPAENTSHASETKPAIEQRHPPSEAPTHAANLVVSTPREDREVIEHVQARLLAEPGNPGNKRDPDYFSRRIATLVSEHFELTSRVVSDRER